MKSYTIFDDLDAHFKKQLPFVIYKKPFARNISVYLQMDQKLHETQDYQESGFVFAPFEKSKKAIILPKQSCKVYHFYIPKCNPTKSNPPFFSKDLQITDSYRQLIQTALSTIQSGPLQKVVLSRTEILTTSHLTNPSIWPSAWFRKLIHYYPDAFCYIWYHPQIGMWLGATPELLLKLQNSKLQTMALAGTLPVVQGKKANWTQKEYKEQQIVTDYLVRALSPFTKKITQSQTCTVQHKQLWHLRTQIDAEIQKNPNLTAILDRLHPTPAVCGYPFDLANAFILKNEGYDRKFYTGFLGELHTQEDQHTTTSNLFVNLRCAKIHDNTIHLFVGGGITKDSIAELEWKEISYKSMTMKKIFCDL